jgi:RIO-like serine/threonine protein kinase
VISIARHSDKNELKKWVKHSELTFKILYDENGQLTAHIIDDLKDFHISYTPFKILVNQKGEMLIIDLPRSAPQEQEEFLNLLNDVVPYSI